MLAEYFAERPSELRRLAEAIEEYAEEFRALADEDRAEYEGGEAQYLRENVRVSSRREAIHFFIHHAAGDLDEAISRIRRWAKESQTAPVA